MDIIIDSAETNGALDEFFETVHYVGGPDEDSNELPEASWPDDDEDEDSEDETKAALLRCTGCGKTYAADNEEEIHDHWTAHDEVDEKGIRYVRTPEGAEHFGQPIGTPIVAGPDVTPAPNVPVALRPRRSRVRRAASSLADRAKRIKWNPLGNGGESSTHEGYTLTVLNTGNGDEHIWTIHAPGAGRALSQQRREVMRGTAPTRAEAVKQAEKAAKDRAKERRNRVEREYENIMELWPGTYGYDWVYPGDKIEIDPKRIEEDPEYREEIAIQHSERMGLQVVLDDGADVPLDVNAHETLNSILAVHEDLFPGFTELFDSVGTTGQGGVYGYNKITFIPSSIDDEHKPYRTGLRFGVANFGDVDGNYESTASSKTYAGKVGWSACDIERLKEANPEDDEWRLAMMTTMVHEIGHTVGRVLFGEMGSYPDGEIFEPTPWMNQQRNDFMTTLQEYFDYYGITTTEMGGGEFTRSVDYGRHQGGTMSNIDRNSIAEMVSQYGSTSFHEMFAEVWAEYLLDDEPREFIQEIGSLMENGLSDWLADKNKFMKKIKKGKK